MNIEEEIEMIVRVISHPSGFNLDMFGGMLCVHGTEDPTCWEVSWLQEVSWGDGKEDHKAFDNARDAARFFCEERRRRELGLEFETFNRAAAQAEVDAYLAPKPIPEPEPRTVFTFEEYRLDPGVAWRVAETGRDVLIVHENGGRMVLGGTRPDDDS